MTIAYYRTEDGKLFTAKEPPDPILEMIRGIRQAHDILASKRHSMMSSKPSEEEKILAELLRQYEPTRRRQLPTRRQSV